MTKWNEEENVVGYYNRRAITRYVAYDFRKEYDNQHEDNINQQEMYRLVQISLQCIYIVQI